MPCQNCKQSFQVSPAEKDLIKKFDVPDPVVCIPCRHQQLYAYRNERALYQRPCDLCKKPMIAMFSEDSDKTVYCRECWWSDKWDPCDYGKDFDFERSFFEQLDELIKTVPLASLAIGDSENSEYTNYAMWNKNCYLISASDYNQDSFYSSYIYRCNDSADCLFTNDSELCYECVDCKRCYDGTALQDCTGCSECLFCHHCRACQNCIGCVNLNTKEFHVFNEPCSREEYKKKREEILSSAKSMAAFQEEFDQFRFKFPHKSGDMENCEGCTGNTLRRCKNCLVCFDLVDCEDCFNCVLGIKVKDSMDSMGGADSELLYCTAGCPGDYHLKFSTLIWPKSSFLEYCLFCRGSKNSFGCISLHKNEYCILNKQYTKAEYEEILPKIIEHMNRTGEYGKFPPMEISPFPYEDTVAADFFPKD